VIAVVGRGFPGLAHTSAARAGVLELVRTLSYEWGPKVRLNCVAPGAVATEGFQDTYDPNIAEVFEGIPMARYGTREEIAHAAVFLSSRAASYITGEVLYVAGGQQNYGRNQALFDHQLGKAKKE
jgi:citronellol/citronellal dehydrogenase